MRRLDLPASGWVPRHYQLTAWHYLKDGGKRCVLLWPRRHGKDDLCLHFTALAAHKRVGSYWHMLPFANQARKALWDAVDPHKAKRRIDLAFPQELRAATREGEMMIKFHNGSTWQLVGSDNYDRLVGTSPAGIVYSEWALSDPNAWTYLSPILEENQGWAIFATTPRGENHATQLFDYAKSTPKWHAELRKAPDCGVFTPEELTDIRSEMLEFLGETEGDAKFRQEYFCDRTAAIPGAYYASLIQQAEDEGRITNLAHTPGHPVDTAWDLGVADSTAIWFSQRLGAVTHVIDYYEASGEGAPHYADILDQKRKAGRWTYGEHVMPHDARVRDWSTGDSRLTVLDRLGIRATIQGTTSLTELGYLQDGIDAVRRLLPICRFDAKRCKQGIAALRSYHRRWDDVRKAFSNRPEHDFSSHGADSFRVLAMHRPAPRIHRRRDRYESDGPPRRSAWVA